MMAGFAQTGSTGKAIGAKNKITDSKSNYSSMNTRYVAVYGSMSQKDIDYVESQASSYWENIDYADSYYDDGEDAWYIASALIVAGDEAYKNQDYETASAYYDGAVSNFSTANDYYFSAFSYAVDANTNVSIALVTIAFYE